jgi:hypothetical protein
MMLLIDVVMNTQLAAKPAAAETLRGALCGFRKSATGKVSHIFVPIW